MQNTKPKDARAMDTGLLLRPYPHHDPHPWRWTPRYRPGWCPLCPTPLSCDARVVSEFRDAEYKRPAMRLAVHDTARKLGWGASAFRRMLTEALRDINVHFTTSYMADDVHDLDLTPLESEKDGYEMNAANEAGALKTWIEEYLLPEFTEETLPDLNGAGKARFMCIASALIAICPELEERLIDLANAENPSPPDG